MTSSHPCAYSGRTISVMIVDDHGILRDSMCAVLSQDEAIHVVDTAENSDEAIAKAIQSRPDIILIDIDMPGLSCFDAIRVIRFRLPDTRFIIVTAHQHDEYIDQAFQARANGYVMKTEGMETLIQAIKEVMDNRIYISPEIKGRLVIKDENKIELENPPNSRLSILSTRERELLRILAKGLTLKQAAAVLNIGYKTADKQKDSLMHKLDIHDRVELARFAIREGMIEP